MTVTSAQIELIQGRVIRSSNPGTAAYIANQINLGLLTEAQYIDTLIAQAATCTKPALLIANYCEGKVPLPARVTSLAAFAQSQHDYYAATGSGNPVLGAYEALGMAFAQDPVFVPLVSGRTLDQIITAAYQSAFLALPGVPQVNHFISQYNYFNALYLANGVPAPDADLRAKGAVVGQVIGAGGMTVGSHAYNKAQAWLQAAGTGTEWYDAAL